MPKEKIDSDKNQAEESDTDDIDSSQCEVYNTEYISINLRYDVQLYVQRRTCLPSNTDADERELLQA